MVKNEFLRRITEFCNGENAKAGNRNLVYKVFEGNARIMEEGFSGGYDDRLEDETWRNCSFTVLAESRNESSVLAQTTFFLTEYDVYKDVFFWKANADRTVLSKVRMGAYRDIIGDWCITIGYTEFADNIRFSPELFFKYKAALTFYRFLKDMVTSPQNFVHLEPAGIYFMSDEILSCDELVLAEYNIDVSELGEVNEDSLAAARIAEKFGMRKMDNLYHDVTLGPVYFSRIP